nr:hypothetical protein [Sulfitobacter algicola]
MRRSRWVYPLINASHILGIALLVGTIVAMNLRLIGITRLSSPDDAIILLRPVAIAGLLIALITGALLFIVQATEYAANRWFQVKLLLIISAIAHAMWHIRLPPERLRLAATVSLIIWPAALICGRMIAYS